MATIEDIKKLLEKKQWTDANECPSGGYYDFPHTRNYDSDLGFLIRKYKELGKDYNILVCIYTLIQNEIKDITLEQLHEWLDDGTLENLILQLGQIVKYIDTTQDIVNDNTLSEGQVIITKGFYNILDGGGAKFIIEPLQREEIYQLLLSNGLYATFTDSIITPEQYGCICDGVTDDTEKFQELIELAQNNLKYEIKLIKPIAIRNIVINKWCKIDFNNVRLIMIGNSGIGLDINPLYNFELSTQQNVEQGFGSQYFKNILIDGNLKQGYTYLLNVSSRDTYFNKITIVNAKSNGLNVSKYDGMNLNDILVKGDTTNYNQDLIGVTVSREDCYFNKLEICYFQTLLKMAVNISSQFNMLHLWNDAIYTIKNIGIDISSAGVGCWYGSIIFDTLNVGFFGGNTYSAGFPMKIGHIRMFKSVGKAYLFKDVTQNVSLNIDISIIDIDCSLSNNTFIGSIWNSDKTINQKFITLGFEKLITSISFIKNGNKLKSSYNQHTVTISDSTNTLNLGKINSSLINDKIPAQVSYGICLIFDSSNNLYTAGILSLDYSTQEFIIYTTKELISGAYNIRLDLDIIISTW